MTQTRPSRMDASIARPGPLMRWRQAAAIAVVTTMVAILAGCSSARVTPAGEPRLSIPSPTPNSESTDQTTWPDVEESITGPGTITIARPSPDAFYFMARYTCTAGDLALELREDSRVFSLGTCGGIDNYQMPLPPDVTELNFTIDIDDGTEFTLSGTFEPWN